VEIELVDAIRQKTTEYVIETLRRTGELDVLISKILAKKVDPLTAAEKALTKQLKNPDEGK